MAAAQSKTPARGKKKVTLTKPPANEGKTARTPRRKTTASKATAPVKKTAAKKTTRKRPVVKKAEPAKATATTKKAPAKKATVKKTAPKAADEKKLYRGYIIRYVSTVTEEDGTEVENLDYITAHDKFHFDIAAQALKESFGLDVDSDKVRVGRIDLLRSECDIWTAIQNAPVEEEAPDGSKDKE